FSPLLPRRAAVCGWLVTGRGHRVLIQTTSNKVTKETTVAAPPSVLPSALPPTPTFQRRWRACKPSAPGCTAARGGGGGGGGGGVGWWVGGGGARGRRRALF